MAYRVHHNGLPVEGRYSKLAKAKREAIRFYRRQEESGIFMKTGWQRLRDGSHNLFVEDVYAEYATGITVVQEA